MEIKFKANNRLALDYLRYRFNAPPTGPIRLSLADDFGRMAVGLYKVNLDPVNCDEDDLTVTLILPRHQTTAMAATHYAFFTEADNKRLNFILDAQLNIDLDTFYLEGIQAGMLKRDVIEAFVMSRRLVSADYVDTLGKRAYRTSLTAIRKATDLLHRKARYHASKIQPPETTKK